MTQAPDRIDRLESVIERIDVKLDAIATDVTDIKVSQARIEERLGSLEQQVGDLKVDVKSQDNRLWAFVVALFLSLGGVLAKLVFFSQI